MDAAQTERDEIIVALLFAYIAARKLPNVVGNATWVTPWDRAHRYIDQLLYQLDRL